MTTPKPKDDSGRISRLEGIVESLAKGQESLTNALRGLHDDIRLGFDRVHERIGRVTERAVDRARIQWSPIIAGGSVLLALAAMALANLSDDVARVELEQHRRSLSNAEEHQRIGAAFEHAVETLASDLSRVRDWARDRDAEHSEQRALDEAADAGVHAGFEERLRAIEREVFSACGESD